MQNRTLLAAILLMAISAAAAAQTNFKSPGIANAEQVRLQAEPAILEDETDYSALIDSLLSAPYEDPEPVISMEPLPRIAFMPAVFKSYIWADTVSPFAANYSGNEHMRWLEDLDASYGRYQQALRSFFIDHPTLARYNLQFLPEPPKEYVVKVNPEDHTIAINEIVPGIESTDLTFDEGRKVHWLKTFNASLQFSQAYVSPNWYQGGNNNLNAILNLYYNVKLNPAYHKNLLFETTAQYKLGINSAPDDTLRNYNVSEDIFQINTVFGVKAAKKWYYSLTAQFKTQLVNSYTSNTNTLRSAFLSPGELNVGLGMTFNTANAKKTFTFDASISPLSYNMMICVNDRMNPAAYGIAEGRHTVSKYGSSGECKMMWKMTKNITLNSRLFGFTDYKRAYCDWENTLVFEINKYLTTQIFAHLRYDTDTPPVENPDWHKLQIKEILSLGFAYKFSTK